MNLLHLAGYIGIIRYMFLKACNAIQSGKSLQVVCYYIVRGQGIAVYILQHRMHQVNKGNFPHSSF